MHEQSTEPRLHHVWSGRETDAWTCRLMHTMVDLCMYHTCIVYSTCTDVQFHEQVQFNINPMDMKLFTDVQT